jgi:hypothetical protein
MFTNFNIKVYLQAKLNLSILLSESMLKLHLEAITSFMVHIIYGAKLFVTKKVLESTERLAWAPKSDFVFLTNKAKQPTFLVEIIFEEAFLHLDTCVLLKVR